MILPIILAGGSGERLWPLSRSSYPKQFLNLLGNSDSFFQQTIKRLPTNENFLAPVIICNEEYRFLIAEQLRQIDRNNATILLEPAANNTAPAIALAAHWAKQLHDDPLLLILPADHLIASNEQFIRNLSQASIAAEQDYLVTFGVKPTDPATGYGYIKVDSQLSDGYGYKISNFIEKPDQATAEHLCSTPGYYWNSGMFLFKAQNYLQELEQFYPAIVESTKKGIDTAHQDLDFIRIAPEAYLHCPSISIDYAVMENTTKSAMYHLSSKWSDIGSWQAVWEQAEKDKDGNYLTGDVLCQETTNCIVHAENRLIATYGLENLVITETDDAVLVANRDKSQKVKKIVTNLKAKNHPAAIEHRKIMRPWGWYNVIYKGDRFQVKHIFVDPGKKLSLQLHNHRSEHWIIVKGHAEVIRGEEKFIVNENESTFIPIGTRHQLANPESTPLEFIEVQSGSYLGEDDIIRFEDDHGRVTQTEQYAE